MSTESSDTDTVLSVRVPPEVPRMVAEMSWVMHKSKKDVVAEAIKAYRAYLVRSGVLADNAGERTTNQ